MFHWIEEHIGHALEHLILHGKGNKEGGGADCFVEGSKSPCLYIYYCRQVICGKDRSIVVSLLHPLIRKLQFEFQLKYKLGLGLLYFFPFSQPFKKKVSMNASMWKSVLHV